MSYNHNISLFLKILESELNRSSLFCLVNDVSWERVQEDAKKLAGCWANRSLCEEQRVRTSGPFVSCSPCGYIKHYFPLCLILLSPGTQTSVFKCVYVCICVCLGKVSSLILKLTETVSIEKESICLCYSFINKSVQYGQWLVEECWHLVIWNHSTHQQTLLLCILWWPYWSENTKLHPRYGP